MSFIATLTTPTVTASSTALSGVYSVTISNGNCSAPVSFSINLLVNPTTAILQQPLPSVTVTAGATATATVGATGTNLSYQWYAGSQTTSQPVTGQTAATLSLSNTQAGQSLTYFCLVTGRCGTVWSNGFALSVQTTTCASMYTLKIGSWNDPTVWSCGRVPVTTDVVTLKHIVTLPVSYLGQARQVRYMAGGRLVIGMGSQLRLAGN